MERIRVLLVEDDGEYCENLGKALACSGKELEVEVGRADRAKLAKTAAKKWDVILTNEAHYAELVKIKEAKVYVLTAQDIKEEGNTGELRRPTLYRYMGVEAMAGKIREVFEAEAGRRFPGCAEKPPVVCGFYSAAAGTGKTALALSVAAALAEEGEEQVLYLSLEELITSVYSLECLAGRPGEAQRMESGLSAAEGMAAADGSGTVDSKGAAGESRSGCAAGGKGTADSKGAAGVGDFLYYLFSRRDTPAVLSAEAYTFRQESGVHTFVLRPGRNPFRTLLPEELEDVMDGIMAWNHFDYVILDLAADLWEGTCFLLECSDWRFLVEDGSFICQERTRALRQHFQTKYGREFWESFITVRNFAENEGEAEREGSFSILREPACFLQSGGRIEINRNGAFGRGAEQIATKIRGTL